MSWRRGGGEWREAMWEGWMGTRGGNTGVGGAGTKVGTSKIQIKQRNRWMWHISIDQQQTGVLYFVSRRGLVGLKGKSGRGSENICVFLCVYRLVILKVMISPGWTGRDIVQNNTCSFNKYRAINKLWLITNKLPWVDYFGGAAQRIREGGC